MACHLDPSNPVCGEGGVVCLVWKRWHKRCVGETARDHNTDGLSTANLRWASLVGRKHDSVNFPGAGLSGYWGVLI